MLTETGNFSLVPIPQGNEFILKCPQELGHPVRFVNYSDKNHQPFCYKEKSWKSVSLEMNCLPGKKLISHIDVKLTSAPYNFVGLSPIQ